MRTFPAVDRIHVCMNCALRECNVRMRIRAHTCVHGQAQAHSHERARHTRAYMQHTHELCAARVRRASTHGRTHMRAWASAGTLARARATHARVHAAHA